MTQETDWKDSSLLHGYEQRINEQGHLETRPKLNMVTIPAMKDCPKCHGTGFAITWKQEEGKLVITAAICYCAGGPKITPMN